MVSCFGILDVGHLVDVEVEHLGDNQHIVGRGTIFQIHKNFLLSKSQLRLFLVLVINLERKMGPQEGDRIEAAVKRPCTAFNSNQNHQVAKIRNENLSLDENMQNN